MININMDFIIGAVVIIILIGIYLVGHRHGKATSQPTAPTAPPKEVLTAISEVKTAVAEVADKVKEVHANLTADKKEPEKPATP